MAAVVDEPLAWLVWFTPAHDRELTVLHRGLANHIALLSCGCGRRWPGG
jgi:hypothetical protein